MIHFVGDLSQEDARVLRGLAQNATNILEFGCGGSTQIIANYTKGAFTSIDTEQRWIDITRSNLAALNITHPVSFQSYYQFTPEGKYDFVFVDGLWKLRYPFAKMIFSHIPVGGVIAFHDTRRDKDMDGTTAFIRKHLLEIGQVFFNQDHSNITVIHKKEYEPYYNWNK